jgi:hypothetical protein
MNTGQVASRVNSVAGGTAPEPAEHDPDEHRERVAAVRGVEGQQVV